MGSGKRILQGFLRAQPQLSSYIHLGNINGKRKKKLSVWLLLFSYVFNNHCACDKTTCVRTHITSKRMELGSPRCSCFEANLMSFKS